MSPALSTHLLRRQPDDRLLALVREGREQAFEALVHRYREPLLAYCRHLLPDAARAEDALQGGLLQAWVALERGTEVRDVKPWLYRIMRNEAIRIQKAPGRDHVELSESLESAGTPDIDMERRMAVQQTLEGVAALPDLQRQALVQTALVGRSHGQVAAALGISEPAVRGLVYRARTTLRAALGAVCPFPLTTWAAHFVRKFTQLDDSQSSLALGAGGTGVAGVLAKSGVVVLSAGAVIAGGEALHSGIWAGPRAAPSVTVASRTAPVGLHTPSAVAGLDGAPGSRVGPYGGDRTGSVRARPRVTAPTGGLATAAKHSTSAGRSDRAFGNTTTATAPPTNAGSGNQSNPAPTGASSGAAGATTNPDAATPTSNPGNSMAVSESETPAISTASNTTTSSSPDTSTSADSGTTTSASPPNSTSADSGTTTSASPPNSTSADTATET
jgi:RNA polymerase sigma factor (sigma-70 family)